LRNTARHTCAVGDYSLAVNFCAQRRGQRYAG